MILIRYGEIALKSSGIRKLWERLLVRNIKNMLEINGIKYDSVKYIPMQGRIYLDVSSSDKVKSILSKIFGIKSFSEVIESTDDLNEISSKVLELASIILNEGDTFAIRVIRKGNHNYTSIEAAKKIGGKVLKSFSNKGIKVDLKSPKKVIYIEIRDNKSYIFTEKIQGLGGLPTGTQGRIISLLSGGIDSPVATWMMMKRGCFIRCVYFDNYPYLPKEMRNKIHKLIYKLREYDPRKNYYYYIVPHGENLKYFIDNIPSKYICLFCKRTMYRVAYELAKKEKALGLVTGENLGQVASQTLDNLLILDNTINLPVFRPLIGLDKEDIINLAKKLGTYKLSISGSVQCQAVPKNPSIKGNLNEIIEIESKIDINSIIKNSVDNAEKIRL